MSKPNSFDFSFDHLPPAVAHKHGAIHVMSYVSWDPRKNMTSDELRGHHVLGTGVTLGWESTSGHALDGAAAGTSDATETLRQFRAHITALGYAPKNHPAVPFAVDRDVTPAQFPLILAYLRAAQKVFDAALDVHLIATAYGEADLMDYLAAHGITVGLFQTYAWSAGRLSQHTSLHQFLNGQKLDGHTVDFDLVINADTLGAWWPPGHRLDIAPTTTTGELTMDKEVTAKFAEIEASLARIESRFIGSDGKPHAVESSVAHVTQGAAYLSKKGRRWARLFRFGDKAAKA